MIHASKNGKPRMRGSMRFTSGIAMLSALMGMAAKRIRNSLRTSIIDDHVAAYLTSTVTEHPVLRELRAETAKLPNAGMQIGADQAQFMQLIAQIIGARNYVEIGVFTGYSSLAMALVLPPDGHVLACDISEEYTAVAQRYWSKAGVAAKISLQLAPALETLDAEIRTRSGHYDIAFIDADKTSAEAYYERCLKLLRSGGVLLVDNTLWNGRVADPEESDPDTVALREITKKAMSDARVDAALTPIGDGLLIVRKK